MKPLDFQHVLKSLAHLSHWQRERLLQELSQPVEGLAAGQIETCFERAPRCPHCAHERIHRHGRSEGLQRYRCGACGKTFNALTGTPLARLRHKAKWLDFLQAMQDSLTVRRSARDVGVHRNTSFRWRHRFLAWSKNDRPEHLHGITEVDETYFLESSKGARTLGRPARKRGGSATKRGISDEQICVLVARDRTGQTLDFVTGKGPVSKAQLRECLPPVLDPDALLVSTPTPVTTTLPRKRASVMKRSICPPARASKVPSMFRTSMPITAGCTSGLNAFTVSLRTTCRTISAGVGLSTRTASIRQRKCSSLPSESFHR